MEKMETKSTATIFFHGFTTIKGEKAPIDWDKERIKDYLIQKAKLDKTVIGEILCICQRTLMLQWVMPNLTLALVRILATLLY